MGVGVRQSKGNPILCESVYETRTINEGTYLVQIIVSFVEVETERILWDFRC
jgi:hypothetical protein